MVESVISEAEGILNQLRNDGHSVGHWSPGEIANWINDATREIACNPPQSGFSVAPLGRTGITISQSAPQVSIWDDIYNQGATRPKWTETPQITTKRPETPQDQRNDSNTYPSMDKSG